MANVFGFETLTDFEPYEKFEEMRLPWGNSVSETGYAYTDFQHGMLDGINFMRTESEPCESVKELKEKCPVFVESFLSNFLEHSIGKIRFMPKSETKIVSPGCIGRSSTDWEFKSDNEYGMANVVFYVEYSTANMRFEPRFNVCALNHHIAEQEGLRYRVTAEKSFDCYDTHYENQLKLFEWLFEKHWLDRFECIPIVVNEYDGVRISHRAYRDNFGRKQAEVTAPCYGLHIREHKDIMLGLQDWFDRGGKIFDKNQYLILASKEDRSKYYLKRYDKVSEGGK